MCHELACSTNDLIEIGFVLGALVIVTGAAAIIYMNALIRREKEKMRRARNVDHRGLA